MITPRPAARVERIRRRMAVRTARSAVALAVATLLVAVAAVLALPGVAQARNLNCSDFTYQEDAQAKLDEDPRDPNGLDRNHDGVACETRPRRSAGAPTTTTTLVTTSTTATPVNVVAATTDTTSTTTGGTTTSTTTATTSTSTTTTTSSDSVSSSGSDSDDSDDDSSSSGTSDEDRDCADFASQAEAQAVLDADLSDPDGLDADLDGIACEDHFGEAGQQVQVHPVGGVDTGGRPAGA